MKSCLRHVVDLRHTSKYMELAKDRKIKKVVIYPTPCSRPNQLISINVPITYRGARHGHKMSAKQKRIELQEKELLMQMKKTYNLDPVEATQNIARLKTENSTNLYEMDTNSKRKHDNSPCEKRKTKLKPIHDPATSTNSLQYTGNLKESSLVEENQNSDKQDPNSKRKKKKKRRKSEESLGCDENLVKHTPNKKKKEKHK